MLLLIEVFGGLWSKWKYKSSASMFVYLHNKEIAFSLISLIHSFLAGNVDCPLLYSPARFWEGEKSVSHENKASSDKQTNKPVNRLETEWSLLGAGRQNHQKYDADKITNFIWDPLKWTPVAHICHQKKFHSWDQRPPEASKVLKQLNILICTDDCFQNRK